MTIEITEDMTKKDGETDKLAKLFQQKIKDGFSKW